MADLKKELIAFKKTTGAEIGDMKKGIDRLSKTMDDGFDRSILAIEQFDYLEKDLNNLEERVSEIEKKLDK